MHLFPRDILIHIVSEINRVLKPGGKVVIDFATNIKRTSLNGEPVVFGKEPFYNLEGAKTLLKNLFRNYEVELYESEVIE